MPAAVSKKTLALLVSLAVLTSAAKTKAQNLIATTEPTEWQAIQITGSNPKDCVVVQGSDLTLLNCKTTYSLFDSHKLIESPFGLYDYGETRAIVGVRESMEEKHKGRITYVQDNKRIMEAYLDDLHQVQKETVMLVNATKVNITDAIVFNDFAAVKAAGYFFYFFARPLTSNSFVQPLQMVADSE